MRLPPPMVSFVGFDAWESLSPIDFGKASAAVGGINRCGRSQLSAQPGKGLSILRPLSHAGTEKCDAVACPDGLVL